MRDRGAMRHALWSKPPSDPWTELEAWRDRLPSGAAFACSTAAWVHGLDTKPLDPVEVMLPPTSSVRTHTGVTVRRSFVPASEVTAVKGLAVTTLHRTLRDLCLFTSPIDALIAMDMALLKRRTDKEKLLGDPVARRGRRGARRLRRLVQLASPAESPMETRLRWILFRAGLPAPEVQVELCDRDGEFVGRADLYYPASRLVIEFDGENHRERLVADDRRQNLLIGAGFRILRFTAADIQHRAEVIAAQVRGSLQLVAFATPSAP